MTGLMLDTARDFLVDVLGEEHALHTVAWKMSPPRKFIIVCSCMAQHVISVNDAKRAVIALRNVPEAPL